MKIHHTLTSLQQALYRIERSQKIALVPTMGNLHQGHMRLMEEAKQRAHVVVASIFVNRLQFKPGEDFEKYPRTLEQDCEKLYAAGVDHVFAPDEAVMYPKPQTYFVKVPENWANVLEGIHRPGHFEGVATVVMKLFLMVRPHMAFFGKKDWQQLRVIEHMVQDFAMGIDIYPIETMRDADGLALSSRNGYLSSVERQEASLLYQVLLAVAQAIGQGNTDFGALETKAYQSLKQKGWEPDYVAVRNKITLDVLLPETSKQDAVSQSVVLAAAKLGSTRLIDNLEPSTYLYT